MLCIGWFSANLLDRVRALPFAMHDDLGHHFADRRAQLEAVALKLTAQI